MKYVIQNVKTKKYLKHNGNYNPDAYHFSDVKTTEEAEKHPPKEHAEFVQMWHADTSQEFEIIEV
ncbi:hypothetical protein QUF88_19345 [Bacillus sp. DX1.1]|uniref:hypothetical protein n=1 Tax=unclassified Bacillus (in: firmicutes) TaxID=185979 RepID=UPI0025700935|nr:MULTISPECIES: hypothetical protein [unclassified Bacillus (in: firmicutes)]MDM5155868.1 hypothetical protein [Bacillus sp. DX1.1]WJE80164.1 hypothetical protein QRE67_16875 [Bacillus sp. DX3.1]